MRTALTVLLVLPSVALAWEGPPPPPDPEPTIIYKDVTELDYETLDIKANGNGPTARYSSDIQPKMDFNFITFRESFDPEMAESVDLVK